MARRVLLLRGKKVILPLSPRTPVAAILKWKYPLCDVTINVTAVNKVSTADVCAQVQRDSSPLHPPFFMCVFAEMELFTSPLKANYFVHQDVENARLFLKLLVTG